MLVKGVIFMGRKAFEVDLHGFTLQELKELRNKTNNIFERGVLATIILRCEGKDNNLHCFRCSKIYTYNSFIYKKLE